MAENVRPACTCELNTAKFCPISQSARGEYRPMKDCATQERDLTRQGEPGKEGSVVVSEGPLTKRIRERQGKVAQG